MSNAGKKLGSPKPLDALLVQCFEVAPEWRWTAPPGQSPVIAVRFETDTPEGIEVHAIDLRDHPKYFERPPGTDNYLLAAEGRKRARRVIEERDGPPEEPSDG